MKFLTVAVYESVLLQTQYLCLLITAHSSVILTSRQYCSRVRINEEYLSPTSWL